MKRSAYYVVFYTHVDDKKCSRGGVYSVYEANFLGYIDTVRFHFISFIVLLFGTAQLCLALFCASL